MKCSDLFVKCLETEGIEYIFGVPGEENADFMMSLEKSDQIRFILTRHEQGAAFMAEVYGMRQRLTEVLALMHYWKSAVELDGLPKSTRKYGSLKRRFLEPAKEALT